MVYPRIAAGPGITVPKVVIKVHCRPLELPHFDNQPTIIIRQLEDIIFIKCI